MNQKENKSTTRIGLIVVGAIVVLTILGGAVYALIQVNQPKPAVNDKKLETTSTVTGEDIDQSIEELKEASDAEKASRERAQTVLNDQLKRIKLTK